MKFQKIFLLVILPLSLILSSCSDKNEQEDTAENSAAKKEYYTCTMHPQVISDRPGVCPICGMELIKKIEYEKENPAEDMEGMISLSGRKQVLADISTVRVSNEKLEKEFTSYSYMDFVEQNRITISARFNGRVEKLFINKTGDYVKKGEPLFEIYSPDLVQAQNEYLIALKNSKNETGSNFLNNGSQQNSLVSAVKEKLVLLGLTPEQIKKLESTGQAEYSFTYYSPIGGTVIEKKVQEGMYINEGTPVYEIADLSALWNIAEVYENNLSGIKHGNKVKLHLTAYHGEEFEGTVDFIYPVINQQSRTVKVRSVFINKGNKLMPQMYGETVFRSSSGEGFLVPADAIIFTGKRAVIWLKTENGLFEARDVKVGEKYNDKYQILSGLKKGDEVAATGGFLIDSESQLRSGTKTSHQHSKTKREEESEHSLQAEFKKEDIVRNRNVKVSSLDKNKDGKVYQCPMDFEVISDKPDICPVCSMDLEEFSVAEAQKNLAD